MPMYFVLTFTVTWSIWFASGIASPAGPNGPLLLLGTFTPGLVALGLTAHAHGRSGVSALLRRLIDWRVPGRWYAFAISYIVVVKLTVAVVYRVAWSEWPRFGDEPWFLLIAATFSSLLMGGQAGEELGWRGYALPRLAERFGLGAAGIVLGLVWALWHLPLFFFPAGDTYGQSFPLYLLQVTALSVTMAWLYTNTRGSLLPVMLLHAAVNNLKDIVPSAEPGAGNPFSLSQSGVGWLTVALMWLFAGYCLVRMGKLSRRTSETSKPLRR